MTVRRPTENSNINRASANFSFVRSGVLVVGVDVTGGVPHDRMEWTARHADNNVFLERQLLTHYGVTASAVLLLGHGKPTNNNRDFFVEAQAVLDRAGVPFDRVLYVHGDGHRILQQTKFGFHCVQTDIGRGLWTRLVINGGAQATEPFRIEHVDLSRPTA